MEDNKNVVADKEAVNNNTVDAEAPKAQPKPEPIKAEATKPQTEGDKAIKERPKRQLNKKLANAKSPHIQAALNSSYSFKEIETAIEKIHFLEDNFIGTKHDLLFEEDPQTGERLNNITISGVKGHDYCVIWIRDYKVTDEEKSKNFLGNFALIKIFKKGKKFTLKAEKLVAKLNMHPQKDRSGHKHPDWGHPVLRNTKNGKVYQSLAIAQKELSTLHEQYPQVTIPNENKLYVIIYDKKANPEQPAQKYVLQLEPHREGGFIINAEANTYQPRAKVTKAEAEQYNEEQAQQAAQSASEAGIANPDADANKDKPVGYFTSKFALKKKKK